MLSGLYDCVLKATKPCYCGWKLIYTNTLCCTQPLITSSNAALTQLTIAIIIFSHLISPWNYLGINVIAVIYSIAVFNVFCNHVM